MHQYELGNVPGTSWSVVNKARKWPNFAHFLVYFCPLIGLILPTLPMEEPEETHEEQVLRVLKEMVESGEVLMEHHEDGEVYFSLKQNKLPDYVYEL